MKCSDDYFSSQLDDLAHRIGEPLPQQARYQLAHYVALLKDWNQKMNLTAIIEDKAIMVHHLLDTCSLLPFLDDIVCQTSDRVHKKIIDVGSGAGIPGIPIKILRPQWTMTLIDARAKRILFLDTVIRELNLQQISTWHGRAEEAGHMPCFREQYDVAVARAVASMPVLCEYCLPLVRVGGIFLAMKGHPEKEKPSDRAIRRLGGTISGIHKLVLPGTEIHHSIWVIRKEKRTPDEYPRRPGRPEKQPL